MSEKDEIIHYTAVRFRVTGVGNLQSTLISNDAIYTQPLANIPMSPATSIRPAILANFQHQRAMLQGKTTVINERFHINRIIIFAKAVFADYPR